MHRHVGFFTAMQGWFSAINLITVSQESNEMSNFSPQVSYLEVFSQNPTSSLVRSQSPPFYQLEIHGLICDSILYLFPFFFFPVMLLQANSRPPKKQDSEAG